MIVEVIAHPMSNEATFGSDSRIGFSQITIQRVNKLAITLLISAETLNVHAFVTGARKSYAI